MEVPALGTTRYYSLSVQTLVGPVQAGFQVRWGTRPTLPVVIYHHGIAETPYDKSFRGIFRLRGPVDAHLVALRAPFHRSWFEVKARLTTLAHFLAMCAVSVQLMETLRHLFQSRGACGSLITGTSLGGFITLLHHLTYGNADCYAPLLAGPDMAHVMLASPFRRVITPQAQSHPETLQALLDFRQTFCHSDTRRVFPLLARYDPHILYSHHASCYAASHVPVVTIGRGHLTGSLAFATLRAHVLTCLAHHVCA
jgi:hypothetical protein